MKKKLLLTIASLGLLASCGANTSSVAESSPLDNSVATSSTTDSTNTSYGDASSTLDSADNSSKENSSSAPVVSDLDITDVIDGLAEFRAKIVVEDVIYNLYGKDVCEILAFDDEKADYEFAEGYVATPNDGVWSYGLDTNGNPVLDTCMFGGHTDNTFVDAGLELYVGVSAIASDTYAEKWEDDDGGFITDDEDTITAVANIAGYGLYAQYGYMPELVTVTTTPTTATFEGEMTVMGQTINVGFTVENLGTNTNTAAEALLVNPTIPTFTEFTDDHKLYMEYLVGQELPFCDKLTAYSQVYLDDEDGDNYYDTFKIEDYRSGNIIDNYGALLTGWTAGDKKIDPDTTVVKQEFTKLLEPATETEGAIYACVDFTYLPYAYLEMYDNYYGENQAPLNPNGIFMLAAGMYQEKIAVDTVDKVNTFLGGIDKQDTTDAIPAFGATFTPNNIDLEDLTADASAHDGLNYVAYFDITGSFATDADAIAALKTWIADLVAAGYGHSNAQITDPAADVFESEGSVTLVMKDAAFQYGVYIYINLGEYDYDTMEYVTGNGAFDIGVVAC